MTLRLLSSLLLLLPALVMADEVYRTLDESGQVIYTDTPPEGIEEAERLELAPTPSAESIREAEAREKAIRRAAERASGQRETRQQAKSKRVAEAEKALAEAEARLTEAKELKDEDRQSLAGRGRKIRPEYFERVKEAEAAVEAARKNLRRVRGGR